MEISTIGLDLAKNIFQVHGINSQGEPVVRKALRRSQMLPFFAKIQPCIVGAVDDLTDIYSDMVDVVRYAENASSNEDTLHFRFGYQVHRGSELHNVRRYLATSNVAAW